MSKFICKKKSQNFMDSLLIKSSFKNDRSIADPHHYIKTKMCVCVCMGLCLFMCVRVRGFTGHCGCYSP